MVDTGVKETLCTRCIHKDVCAYKHDYLDIIKAVENVTVTKDMYCAKKVIDYDFIGTIHVSCRYYEKHTEIYCNKSLIG